MKKISLAVIAAALMGLTACGGGDVGDECSADEDCKDELHCHFHEGEEHGECEDEHDDEDTDHEDTGHED